MTAGTQAGDERAMALVAQARGERAQLALSFAAFILIGLNDGVVGVLLPSVIAHYHISTATVGWLFPASSLGYLAAAFNSGGLLERLGRRGFLGLGAGVWMVGLLVFATLPPFLALLPALFDIGFGAAIIDAGLNAYIAGLPRGASLLNYLHAFYGVGALLGPLLATLMLTSIFGWNATYYALALGGAAALLGFLLRFERRRAPAHHDEANGGLLRAALRSPLLWLSAVFLLVYVGIEVSLGAWSYSLLTLERAIPRLAAGWMVSGYWLGLTLGRFLLARLVERVGPQRMIQWLTGGVIAGVALVWVAPPAASPLAAVGLWLVGFSLGPIFPSVIAVISSVTSERLRQSAIGFAASLGSMGAALFPWVAANLAQRLGLWSLLPYIIVLSLVMLALWLWLRRSLRTIG